MSDKEAFVGSNPVKVALVIDVGEVRTKSSAASISVLPADDGREAIAILPSGSPVLKKNVLPALAGTGRAITASKESAIENLARISCSFADVGAQGERTRFS